jgi:hypothetical protein
VGAVVIAVGRIGIAVRTERPRRPPPSGWDTNRPGWDTKNVDYQQGATMDALRTANDIATGSVEAVIPQ